jgi:hypothetical protein
MYYREGMERRLRKGDIGEALFREWFERVLGKLEALGYTLEQQGYNPGGFVDLSEKKHLKEKNDPDFAIYSAKTGKPLVGISINTQSKFYTASNAMGGKCIKCPRAWNCSNSNEKNLWYNRYNLDDYAKFERRFGVETCMVTLRVNTESIAKYVRERELEDIVHAYIFDGGKNLRNAEREKLEELKRYLRHGRKAGWKRPLEIRWVLRSELEEITPQKSSVPSNKIPFWVTGGRVEKGRPRDVCCVDAGLARGERELIEYLSSLAR